ncbi:MULTISPECIES: hypothetical protein [unclassified Streptosporangium]|nr:MULTISPECIES: hypothetical protein [unclassified Streptosporangium]
MPGGRGPADVRDAIPAEWNVAQPVDYVWLRHAGLEGPGHPLGAG